MVGLIDIVPAATSVSVRGSQIDVYGVSVSGIGQLFARFPEIRQMVSGREVTVEAIAKLSGPVVAAIIAAGTGKAGDEKTESIAEALSFSDQVELLYAIWEATFPNGIDPLVKKLSGAAEALGVNVPEVAQDAEPATKSAKQSKG